MQNGLGSVVPPRCDCTRCDFLAPYGGVLSHNSPPVPLAPHLFKNEAVRGFFQHRIGQATPSPFATSVYTQPGTAPRHVHAQHKQHALADYYAQGHMQHTAPSSGNFAMPMTPHPSVLQYDGGLPAYLYDGDYGGLPLFEDAGFPEYGIAPHVASLPPVMYASPPPVMYASPPRSLRSMTSAFDSPPGASSSQQIPTMSIAERHYEAKRRNNHADEMRDGDDELQRQVHMTRLREVARQSLDLPGAAQGLQTPRRAPRYDGKKRDRG